MSPTLQGDKELSKQQRQAQRAFLAEGTTPVKAQRQERAQ